MTLILDNAYEARSFPAVWWRHHFLPLPQWPHCTFSLLFLQYFPLKWKLSIAPIKHWVFPVKTNKASFVNYNLLWRGCYFIVWVAGLWEVLRSTEKGSWDWTWKTGGVVTGVGGTEYLSWLNTAGYLFSDNVYKTTFHAALGQTDRQTDRYIHTCMCAYIHAHTYMAAPSFTTFQTRHKIALMANIKYKTTTVSLVWLMLKSNINEFLGHTYGRFNRILEGRYLCILR